MAAPTPQQIAAYNDFARRAIKAKAVPMRQQIFGQTFSGTNVPAQNPVININPRNVGLIRGFWVQVTFNVNNGAGVDLTLSDFGPSNILSQVVFYDLQNNVRIQTTGWHLNLINSIKGKRPYDAAFVNGTGIDSPVDYGANMAGQISALGTVTTMDATNVCTMWYYVPLSYSHDDLRGAVYASVVNATMQLQLTLNPNAIVANGSDSTSAVYFGATAGSVAAALINSVTINVYQDYLDQLPMGPSGAILPIQDIATIYELKNTVFSGFTPAQDFPMQYSNFRNFLSTCLIYVNAAAGTRGTGTDINYFALQSANYTNIWKNQPPLTVNLMRAQLGSDFPLGAYYFGSREKPISTIQYGNMELVLNPVTAAAGNYCLVGYEDFALVQQISNAGSLPAVG